MDATSLSQLPYRKLQKLAKERGHRANLKTEKLIKLLLESAVNSSEQTAPHLEQPPQNALPPTIPPSGVFDIAPILDPDFSASRPNSVKSRAVRSHFAPEPELPDVRQPNFNDAERPRTPASSARDGCDSLTDYSEAFPPQPLHEEPQAATPADHAETRNISGILQASDTHCVSPMTQVPRDSESLRVKQELLSPTIPSGIESDSESEYELDSAKQKRFSKHATGMASHEELERATMTMEIYSLHNQSIRERLEFCATRHQTQQKQIKDAIKFIRSEKARIQRMRTYVYSWKNIPPEWTDRNIYDVDVKARQTSNGVFQEVWSDLEDSDEPGLLVMRATDVHAVRLSQGPEETQSPRREQQSLKRPRTVDSEDVHEEESISARKRHRSAAPSRSLSETRTQLNPYQRALSVIREHDVPDESSTHDIVTPEEEEDMEEEATVEEIISVPMHGSRSSPGPQRTVSPKVQDQANGMANGFTAMVLPRRSRYFQHSNVFDPE